MTTQKYLRLGLCRRHYLDDRLTAHSISYSYNYGPLYQTWTDMRSRCHDINNKAYHNYGGRGIKVCKRWDSFGNFLADMGDKPTTGHSIDRVNNNKGYSPSNCRWATRTEQNRNRRAPKDNTSGVMGVSFDKRSGKWVAYIRAGGVLHGLGYYNTIPLAATARKEGELRYW